eukprot:GHVU01083358.1.p3 GENE.GHVU01083358.1~~GHVU01083358.1.p3  ORF type:complete len:133 (+),score=5.29 GHVU01083358.1:390-788(+)
MASATVPLDPSQVELEQQLARDLQANVRRCIRVIRALTVVCIHQNHFCPSFQPSNLIYNRLHFAVHSRQRPQHFFVPLGLHWLSVVAVVIGAGAQWYRKTGHYHDEHRRSPRQIDIRVETTIDGEGREGWRE